MDKTGVIILAAGSSSRLGQPKQLLSFQGKTLLQRVIDEAVSAQAATVVVVLGANHQLIAENTNLNKTSVVVNEQWQSGMASSIKAGIGILTGHHEIESALLTLCDQPYVDGELLAGLVQAQQNSGKPIVACAYGGIVGVPAVFSREMFPDLMALQGLEGARKLISAKPEQLVTVPFPNGVIDIDTIADYQHLTDEEKKESDQS